MSSSEHCRQASFQIYNVQNLKITRITTFRICNVVYQAGFRWDPKCVFNFLRFFERTLYKSNYVIFILSWCGTHTKIRSKLVDILTAGSQKITLWGPQRTPLGILRVKQFFWNRFCFWNSNSWRRQSQTVGTVKNIHNIYIGIYNFYHPRSAYGVKWSGIRMFLNN